MKSKLLLGLLISSCCALALGCGEDTVSAPRGTATVDGTYRVTLDFLPERPIPDQEVRATVTVMADVKAVDTGDVTLSAVAGDSTIDDIELDNDGDGQWSTDIAFGEGTWTVRVLVRSATGFADYAKFTLRVTCAGDGSIGATCCRPSHCDDSLSCVAGACAADLGGVDDACFGPDECATGNCEDGLCRDAPSCTDGRTNGTESDLDCGGDCDACIPGQLCAADADCEGPCIDGVCSEGVDILGNGGHTADDVELTLVTGGMDDPMDLEFHPDRTDELWVANLGNNSMWIGTDVGRGGSNGRMRHDPTGDHFMVFPSSLAFGGTGYTSTVQDRPSTDLENGRCLATVHETDDPTPYTDGAPGTFMGPTLWTADSQVFDGGHASHYDMLHNSPNGMGIAWQEGNTYWVFDGYHSAVTRYEFHGDHGPGGGNHADGDVARFVSGEVSRMANVPSHMVLDHETGLLYIADTGNARIAVLDTTSGSRGRSIGPNYDGTRQYTIDGAEIGTLVDAADIGIERPSGIEFHQGMIFVSDNATGRIVALTMDGALVDWLDTGLGNGALKGIAFHPDGDLYLVNANDDSIYKITPKAE